MKRATTLLILPALLAACGGGGGRPCTGWGVLQDPFCTPVRTPSLDSRLSVFGLNGADATGTLTFAGGAVQAHQQEAATTIGTAWTQTRINAGALGSNEETDRDNIYVSRSLGVAGVDIGTITTDAAGRLDAERGATDSFLATLRLYNGGQYYTSDAARLTIRNMDGGAGTGLSYASYGYWEAEFPAEGALPAFGHRTGFAFGEITPGSALPTSGDADYSGTMTGLYSAASGPATAASGAVDMSVDFATRVFEGGIHDIAAGGTALRDIALAPDVMSGGTFLGSAATRAPAPGQTGPEMAGTYYGGLYGPAAEEAAGAFAVSGGGANLVGGFAGAVQP